MQGSIIRYDFQSGRGAISGDDGNRYSFDNEGWKENYPPAQNMRVDFDDRISNDGQGRQAVDVYVVPESASSPSSPTSPRTSQKSKTTAGLFALFLGPIGVHKFYLGYTGVGILYIILTITLIGMFFTFPVSMIEGIIYLTKSDEEFERIYVQGRKAWF